MATITYSSGGNISSSRYVDITSGVGGSTAVDTKQLIPRLFTTNEMFPTNAIVTFTSASSVLSYLNSDSTADEYLMASYMFGYISKAIRTMGSMSIARWADTDTSAQVYGSEVADLDDLIEYTSASLSVTLDGSTNEATGIDLSGASSYADVATILQTALSALDDSLSDLTVTYNSTSTGFNVDTNGTADGAMTFSSDTSGFLADIGLSSSAVFSSGIEAQSLTSLMSTTIQTSNDFGTFAFVDDLTIDQVEELASWNSDQNFQFMGCFKCLTSEASEYYSTLNGYGGCAVTLYDDDVTDEYPWLHPCAEAGAIDPDQSSAFPNFMFAPDSDLSALITSDDDADTYDALRMNYMGRTQESGTELTWYQRGVLMGGDTDATTMSVYLGEVWLKAELKAQFLSMFNALPGITADIAGKSYINAYIEAACQSAIDNGVFSIGKDLTTTQKSYINQITGDESAWQKVKSDGYWYTIDFDSETATSGITEYSAEYTLVYAKSDKIRSVTGTHVLI